MTVLQALKAVMVPGARIAITNHYITKKDHPCYGTRVETVTKTTSGRVMFTPTNRGVPWPKASAVKRDGDAFLVYGHPTPEALFLTIRPTVQS